MIFRCRLAAFALAAVTIAATQARAQSVIERWAGIAAPPVPTVQSVTLAPGTTALLLLDFVSQTCNPTVRPRCIASLPAVARLLARARAHKARVIYSYVPGGTPADIAPSLAPRPGEQMVQSGPDKFLGTNLAALLHKDGIRTVIVTGTAAEGAVLSTASEAAFRGYRIILPADGLSSANLYAEQYVVWDLLHSPGTAGRTILTTTGRIQFGK
ncbi:MAG: cysteine hydrolase [Acetobacteraceae bacterium]